jgi:hypothetical protein
MHLPTFTTLGQEAAKTMTFFTALANILAIIVPGYFRPSFACLGLVYHRCAVGAAVVDGAKTGLVI